MFTENVSIHKRAVNSTIAMVHKIEYFVNGMVTSSIV
jgi:hypothetical protein